MVKVDSHSVINHPYFHFKDFSNFVRFTHKMLVNIKYVVVVYVAIGVKRMLRKC
jgi:hypothetical protein